MVDKSEKNSNRNSDPSTQLKSSNIQNSSIASNMIDNDSDNESDAHSNQLAELNNRINNDIMSCCLSLLHENEETAESVQILWSKYLQYVGDVAVVSEKVNIYIDKSI